MSLEQFLHWLELLLQLGMSVSVAGGCLPWSWFGLLPISGIGLAVARGLPGCWHSDAPVVKGPVVTARAIKSYGWATVLLSGFGVLALPAGGLFYGVMLLPYNGRLLQLVHRLSTDPDNLTYAKGLFRWSILYLFGICLLLILSRVELAVDFDRQVMASAGSARRWLMLLRFRQCPFR